MTSRAKLIERLQNIPDEFLVELAQLISDFEQGKKVSEPKEDDFSELNALAQIRKIRISATPDFSMKANLYDIENKNGE